MRYVGFCFIIIFSVVSASFAQLAESTPFASVNTIRDEMNPVVSPDGKTLYVTIANHPSNVGGKNDPGDIWISDWSGGGWTPPRHGGAKINDMAYNAVADVTADGAKLFLLSHYDQRSTRANTQGIAVAERRGNGWSDPKNIRIPFFLNRSAILSGCFNSTFDVFIFAAENYGTRGVEDLYVTTLDNGLWTEPRNLGAVVNTPFQEVTPWLSDDDQVLYFSSNGRPGKGSFDIYSCRRLDDSWLQWSDPVNLGASINTEGRDLYYRDYEQFGYKLLTSTINSDGYADIKFQPFNRPPEEKITDATQTVQADTIMASVNASTSIPLPSKEARAFQIYGTITDARNGQPVSSSVVITAVRSGKASRLEAPSGRFTSPIDTSVQYTVRIEAAGYISLFEKFEPSAPAFGNTELNFSLQPLEVGARVNLKNVLFEQSKADLLIESFDELDVVVSFMKANPGVRIELAGHTDNRGVHSDNVKLSQERVNTVKRYLVEKGIESRRVSGKGYGGNKPIASNDSEETRRMNRRVEFTILKR